MYLNKYKSNEIKKKEESERLLVQYRQEKLLKDIKFMKAAVPSIRFFLISITSVSLGFYFYSIQNPNKKEGIVKKYFYKLLDLKKE